MYNTVELPIIPPWNVDTSLTLELADKLMTLFISNPNKSKYLVTYSQPQITQIQFYLRQALETVSENQQGSNALI